MPFKRATKTWDENALYDYAVGALGRRMRTVAELKRLLRTRLAGQAPEQCEAWIEAVIARLKEQRYLNDSDYAATFSALRRDNDKLGRQRVITDLKARGVHGEVIEKAVGAAYGEVNEEQLARQFLARKRLGAPKNEKEAARIFRTLARAGFRSATIFRILKNWKVDDELLSSLDSEPA